MDKSVIEKLFDSFSLLVHNQYNVTNGKRKISKYETYIEFLFTVNDSKVEYNLGVNRDGKLFYSFLFYFDSLNSYFIKKELIFSLISYEIKETDFGGNKMLKYIELPKNNLSEEIINEIFCNFFILPYNEYISILSSISKVEHEVNNVVSFKEGTFTLKSYCLYYSWQALIGLILAKECNNPLYSELKRVYLDYMSTVNKNNDYRLLFDKLISTQKL